MDGLVDLYRYHKSPGCSDSFIKINGRNLARKAGTFGFTARKAGSTVQMVSVFGSKFLEHVYQITNQWHYLPRMHLMYSTDGVNWDTFLLQEKIDATPGRPDTPTKIPDTIYSKKITLPEVGSSVWIKAYDTNGSTCSSWGTQAYWNFRLTGEVNAHGDVTSLLNANVTLDEVPCDYCFAELFSGNSALFEAPMLPSTILKQHCYRFLFRNCSNLRTAPALPAKVMKDYCYGNMFSYCSSLSIGPEVLPAMQLANGCYSAMFIGCTILKNPPELPAVTPANTCYNQMFEDCPGLIRAPEIMLETLSSTSIKRMFHKYNDSNRNKIDRIKVHFTNWNENYALPDNSGAGFWYTGLPTSGTFICPSSLDVSPAPENQYRVPPGWTVQTY